MKSVGHHKTLYQIFKRAAWLWYDRDTDRASAAVSYWTMFSVAPLLLFITFIANSVFGHEYVLSILTSWGNLLGAGLIDVLTHATNSIRNAGIPIIGPIFFIGIAVVGMNEFTNGLHTLWDQPHQGLVGFIKKCFSSTLFILFLSLLTFFALAVQSPFTILEFWFANSNKALYSLIITIHTFTTILLLTALFTTAFMLLPFKSYPFRSSLFGGFIAAVLFSFGKLLIAIYTNITPVPELYGTAGVMVLLLIWIFFSTTVIYYGAAVTRAHAELCKRNKI